VHLLLAPEFVRVNIEKKQGGFLFGFTDAPCALEGLFSTFADEVRSKDSSLFTRVFLFPQLLIAFGFHPIIK
jgi:hypothetical protein